MTQALITMFALLVYAFVIFSSVKYQGIMSPTQRFLLSSLVVIVYLITLAVL